MSDQETMGLIRDSLASLRTDIGKVYDRVDDFVTANSDLHRVIDQRLAKIESTTCKCVEPTRWPTAMTALKVVWPLALILIVLLRDASTETKAQVTRIATTAAGLPDIKSGASVRQEHASSTYTVKQGGPR